MPTQPTEKETLVKVTLDFPAQINGENYPAGTHEVPEGVAEDLKRNDERHAQYVANLNKNNPQLGNGGSISAA